MGSEPTLPSPDAVPAYVLAGGASRRFGADKARATLRGEPLLVRLSRQLRAMGRRVIVVARRPDQYADLALDTIADIQPGQGPVGGLRTALAHRAEGWLLLCSCDMLDIDDRWIAALAEAARRSPAADAIVARDVRWQPFPGLYHARLLQRPALQDADSFQRLLERVRTEPLAAEGLPPIRQVNTAEDLRRAEATAGADTAPE